MKWTLIEDNWYAMTRRVRPGWTTQGACNDQTEQPKRLAAVPVPPQRDRAVKHDSVAADSKSA